MKVYLGREVADYQKDFKAFHDSEIAGRTASDPPLVLVTREKKLSSDKALQDFAESNRHWVVGPYLAVEYIVKEEDNTQDP